MSSLVAVSSETLADTDTPVSAYLKLCGEAEHGFLFESGEAVDGLGRHSIVAWDPLCRLRLSHEHSELWRDGRIQQHSWRDFFDLARRTAEELTCDGLPDLPFVGSLIGYLGHDAVRLIERLGPLPVQDEPIADLYFPTRFAIFDHLLRKLVLVALAPDQDTGRAMVREMGEMLRRPLDRAPKKSALSIDTPPAGRYQDAVERAKEYIMAGDIFQVVLSDKFTGSSDVDPFDVYRRLRAKSPSPYMFHLKMNGMSLVGASPETMVKLENGTVIVRPIAGTRGRSRDPQQDRALEQEMMASEKERAEHVMLVDLARNDVGRVSGYGTVRVDPYMIVERFSHVMHITSQVNGRLKPGLDVWDVFTAAFPAGTVSGAPKVRALQIIDELETEPRGAYAGAVGCFGPGQRMDTCIGIRMFQFTGGRFVLQTGAGIVADSQPEMEYREINHKAAQGLAAIKAAAEGEL